MKNILSKEISSAPSWRLYSLSIVLLFTLLQIIHWSAFPLFIDIYYHLSVMQGFSQAGGYVTEAFWEYAPFGRFHLYPPLMHLLMVFLYKLGVPLISIARIFDCFLYPLTLLFIWLVFKDVFGERFTFLCLLLISSTYTFYLSILNNLSASLTLLFILLILFCIKKNKILAGSIFMTFSFYTHFFISFVGLLTFIFWGILERKNLKITVKILFFGILLASPLLLYQLSHLRYFIFRDIKENYFLEINPFIFLLFIFGIVISLRKKGNYYFFLCLALGMLPLLFSYRYRYFCSQGLVSFIFLAAVALDSLYEKLSVFKLKLTGSILLSVIMVLIFIFSPTMFLVNSKVKFHVIDSTFSNFVYQPNIRSNDKSVYFPKFYDEIIKIIKENTEADDIIYSNLEYMAGAFGAFTGRATSTGMLFEIRPREYFDPIKVAKLVIWLKHSDAYGSLEPVPLIKKYGLMKISETEIAHIYKNPMAIAKRVISRPVISLPLVAFFLLTFIGLIVWDFLC